jgi:hypothetical protein
MPEREMSCQKFCLRSFATTWWSENSNVHAPIPAFHFFGLTPRTGWIVPDDTWKRRDATQFCMPSPQHYSAGEKILITVACKQDIPPQPLAAAPSKGESNTQRLRRCRRH